MACKWVITNSILNLKFLACCRARVSLDGGIILTTI